MQLNDLLALLAQGLLIIALPIVIAFMFQWMRQKGAEFRARLTTQQQQFIESAVNFAVHAAEQQITGGGAGKKSLALKAAQDYLDHLGVKLDVNLLSNLIEAEVHKQFSTAAPPVDSAEARSALLDKAVQAGVMAAEQSGINGTIQNLGPEKKRYALALAAKYLEEHSIRVDPVLVNGLIEAEIGKQHQS
jgi:hypothetical protein